MAIAESRVDNASFDDCPPFPNNVPTCPLLRISLKKLLEGDSAEQDRLWSASCDVGFFYLDLRTGPAELVDKNEGKYVVDGEALIEEADRITKEVVMAKDGFFNLPLEEKVKYDANFEKSLFGYKRTGVLKMDRDQKVDQNEFFNISKDDLLGFQSPSPTPESIAPHRPLLASFARHAQAVSTFLLTRLNDRLGLQPGVLTSMHRLSHESGDHVRFTCAQPPSETQETTTLGAHTDLGSVTVLFNRLGGLQVLLPERTSPEHPSDPVDARGCETVLEDGRERTWAWVRPLAGHAVINLGDALVKFTSGVLRSNIHRVAAPPAAQRAHVRHSLVYFVRPEETHVMRVLEGSALIDAKRKEVDGFWDRDPALPGHRWIFERNRHAAKFPGQPEHGKVGAAMEIS
ncbi:Oxidoreductase [Lasiodiplodia theobromae]|uniref:Oxidoreductase n=1 Tax=Lasiodiplodia theobromae TaxID=45133 RepID=UPI0015C3D6FC|nr:Oxidoreductase [Lasiodiplodia theobromae]KAF4545837.1 Oxidoreductase [Lasiodiplodia theobromae]